MRTVSILTHSYVDGYNRQFNRLFGGGLERYIRDLCGVIHAAGWRPVVHQLSYFEPFRTMFEGTEVIGYTYELGKLGQAFDAMSAEADGLIVYASCLWHPIQYRPGSIGISHGINWDHCAIAAETKDGVAAALRQAMRSLERVVSVDSHFLTYARSVCVYEDTDKVIRIPNSVDTSRYLPAAHGSGRPRTRGLRVLVPRRLSYERGVITMMLVADELLRERSDLVIEFAGELVEGTDIADAFRLWYGTHPAKERIEQRTYPMDGMHAAYGKADIVVIPTIFSEGTSLSCLEAMSCGVPVVATNVGGLNDLIIDGLNGRLVPPASAALLAAIRELLGDPAQRRKLGKLARETARTFDASLWRARWTAVLAEQLGEA
ncbi:glycosyl transferase group 1 [Paenibacillus curdlanolyticus YK9]|uniref:Glycosyl transferase group 1 n=1 Tax=Paenibacillus curdlanolyticus YK9 TaxID=717606 RepID=E0IET7_9BACL|nr:glycosyltransferase family 4 protein [Paenibacillus curdlanolyticus]EFM08363.1 glycosyl transferase group 1 [Paenibacillus curdlanolyticus YK9]EFM09175.1 glycosyl transferase group 1 [Paenibacillus curdlanolyticus YK9]